MHLLIARNRRQNVRPGSQNANREKRLHNTYVRFLLLPRLNIYPALQIEPHGSLHLTPTFLYYLEICSVSVTLAGEASKGAMAFLHAPAIYGCIPPNPHHATHLPVSFSQPQGHCV